MSEENKQHVDQLLMGVYNLCLKTENCKDCSFYRGGCVFGDPKPRTWYGDETAEVAAETSDEKVEKKKSGDKKSEEKKSEEEKSEEVSEQPEKAAEPVIENIKSDDDSDGTWIMSTTMGNVLTKYVFICSKCGFKKESYLSITPVSFCPECEKRKKEQS